MPSPWRSQTMSGGRDRVFALSITRSGDNVTVAEGDFRPTHDGPAPQAVTLTIAEAREVDVPTSGGVVEIQGKRFAFKARDAQDWRRAISAGGK